MAKKESSERSFSGCSLILLPLLSNMSNTGRPRRNELDRSLFACEEIDVGRYSIRLMRGGDSCEGPRMVRDVLRLLTGDSNDWQGVETKESVSRGLSSHSLSSKVDEGVTMTSSSRFSDLRLLGVERYVMESILFGE